MPKAPTLSDPQLYLAHARAAIQHKIAEHRAALAALAAALIVLGGKRTPTDPTADTPKAPRADYSKQFHAMMDYLTSRRGEAVTGAQIREALKASGKYIVGQNSTTLWNHLASAARRGLVLRRGKKYLASPTIQKIAKAAPKLTATPAHKKKAKALNGQHSRRFLPDLYQATIDVVLKKPAATKADIRAALKERELPTSALRGHLEKAIDAGIIAKKGKGPGATFVPKNA